ncbi:MAG: hypothetical protein ACTHNK_12540, partial [Thermomicrobiales bacterium]
LRWPFPTQGSESLIVWEAHLLAEGKSIYVANTPDQHGFISGPYTPLYFVAVAATLKLTPTIYTGGRVIAFCAWLLLIATVAALTLAAARRRSAWLGALVAAVSLAVFSPGVIWAVRVKPTIPALALAAFGLLVVQLTWNASRPYYLWALPFFIAGYFTKQTTLAAASAAMLFLLVRLGPRAGLRFVGVGALGGAAPFALLTLATRGEFLRHIVTDRRLAWQFQLVRNFGGLFLRDYWPLLVAALVAAVALAWARVPTIAPYYLLTALVITPVTIGVEGADHDHLIELAAAAALVVGAGLAAALTGRALPVLAAWPVAALLVAQVVTGWTPDRWYAGELTVPSPQVRLQLERIVTNIRGTPGDVLAEEVGLPLLAGKPVPYDDPQAMAALARVGRWDEQQLLDDLNQRRFSLVVLPANPRDELWTPEVLAAIHANYTLKFRDVWFTWEAKR